MEAEAFGRGEDETEQAIDRKLPAGVARRFRKEGSIDRIIFANCVGRQAEVQILCRADQVGEESIAVRSWPDTVVPGIGIILGSITDFRNGLLRIGTGNFSKKDGLFSIPVTSRISPMDIHR